MTTVRRFFRSLLAPKPEPAPRLMPPSAPDPDTEATIAMLEVLLKYAYVAREIGWKLNFWDLFRMPHCRHGDKETEQKENVN